MMLLLFIYFLPSSLYSNHLVLIFKTNNNWIKLLNVLLANIYFFILYTSEL